MRAIITPSLFWYILHRRNDQFHTHLNTDLRRISDGAFGGLQESVPNILKLNLFYKYMADCPNRNFADQYTN
jgi:hypothetical protein